MKRIKQAKAWKKFKDKALDVLIGICAVVLLGAVLGWLFGMYLLWKFNLLVVSNEL